MIVKERKAIFTSESNKDNRLISPDRKGKTACREKKHLNLQQAFS